MASPFERAFTPAFQAAADAARRSLDEERQDKRLQERMLEQRQYDAGLLRDSKDYTAKLLGDSRVYEKGQTDEIRKIAADNLAATENAALLQSARNAGVPFRELANLGKSAADNDAIKRLTSLEVEGRNLGADVQKSGAGVEALEARLNKPDLYSLFPVSTKATGFFEADTPERRGWEAAHSAYTEKGLVDSAATQTAANLRGVVGQELVKAEAAKVKLTDEKLYKTAVGELKALGIPVNGGEAIEQLNFLKSTAIYDQGLKRSLSEFGKKAEIDRLNNSNAYLGQYLLHLNADEVARVEASGDENAQAVFLRKNLQEITTAQKAPFGSTASRPVTTYRLRLMPELTNGAVATPPVNPLLSTGEKAQQAGKPVVPPPDNVTPKMERQSIGEADAAVIREILGSGIGDVRENFKGAALAKGSGTLATLNKSLEADKQGLESLLSRTEIRTMPDGMPYTANKIGFWGRYGDDSEAARKALSPNNFTKYEAETRKIAVEAKVIQSRIDAGSVKISKLADQLESLRPRLRVGDLRQLDEDRSLVPLPKPRVDRNAPNKPPSLGVDRFMPSRQTVPPPPRLDVPPVMAPPPAIPDQSAPRTEADFERMLRENPSQFGGELRGLFDSIMRNRKSNTIKKNLSPQFPPPIPDPRLNLPRR